MSKKTKEQQSSHDGKNFLTIGIGASAGGIKVLTEFFTAMPSDSGMAFVVIPHLSQTNKSNLAAILQRQTKMEVTEIAGTVEAKLNNIYVIPPGKHLEMLDGLIKEELQSVNEELTTVNHELKEKMDELGNSNSDLENLMQATDIATIFLDKNLNIKRYTPRITEIFNIIPGDVGRPLSHVTHQLSPDDFQKHAFKVIQTLQPMEYDVQSDDGRFFIARYSPYRTLEDKIDGVVISFIDVTKNKKTEKALQISQEKYATLFDSIDQGFCIIEVMFDENENPYDCRFLEANAAFAKLTGKENPVGKSIKEMSPEYEQYCFDIYGKVAKTGESAKFEHEVKSRRFYQVYVFRTANLGENQVAVLFDDITQRKRNENDLAFLNEINQDLLQLTSINETMNALSSKIGKHFNALLCAFAELNEKSDMGNIRFGWKRPDVPDILGTRRISDYLSENTMNAIRQGETIIQNIAESGQTEDSYVAKFGNGSVIMVPFLNGIEPLSILCIYDSAPREWRPDEVELIKEITRRIWSRVDRAKIEAALQKSEERLMRATKAARVGTFIHYPQENRCEPDSGALALCGLPNGTSNLFNGLMEIIHPDDRQRFSDEMAAATNPSGYGILDSDIRIQHPD